MVARLHESIVKAVNAPDIRARFADDGLVVFGNTPEQFADMIKGDLDYVTGVVKKLNIQPE